LASEIEGWEEPVRLLISEDGEEARIWF